MSHGSLVTPLSGRRDDFLETRREIIRCALESPRCLEGVLAGAATASLPPRRERGVTVECRSVHSDVSDRVESAIDIPLSGGIRRFEPMLRPASVRVRLESSRAPGGRVTRAGIVRKVESFTRKAIG